MPSPVMIDKLASDIWNVYTSDTANAEQNIDEFLAAQLKNLSASERVDTMKRLIDAFEGSPDADTQKLLFDNQTMGRIFSLLLGRDISSNRLSNAELIRKSAESLNTIFDSLNLLINTINMTFYGKSADEKTIRHVIGSHLAGRADVTSIEDHIRQINKAFLIAQRAFKASVRSMVTNILHEMNPEEIEANTGGGIHIGPLHKAKSYEVFKNRYFRLKQWFESDRFMEDFLKAFEKQCQKLIQE